VPDIRQWYEISVYIIAILVIVEKLRTDMESLPRQDLDPISKLAITFQKVVFPLSPE
jgi:hypothetical protein